MKKSATLSPLNTIKPSDNTKVKVKITNSFLFLIFNLLSINTNNPKRIGKNRAK